MTSDVFLRILQMHSFRFVKKNFVTDFSWVCGKSIDKFHASSDDSLEGIYLTETWKAYILRTFLMYFC